MMPRAELLTREQVRELARCPQCRAEPPAPCLGARGRQREANHRGRVIYAQRAVQAAPLTEIRQAAAAAAGVDPSEARRRAFALVAAERPELAERARQLAGEGAAIE